MVNARGTKGCEGYLLDIDRDRKRRCLEFYAAVKRGDLPFGAYLPSAYRKRIFSTSSALTSAATRGGVAGAP